MMKICLQMICGCANGVLDHGKHGGSLVAYFILRTASYPLARDLLPDCIPFLAQERFLHVLCVGAMPQISTTMSYLIGNYVITYHSTLTASFQLGCPLLQRQEPQVLQLTQTTFQSRLPIYSRVLSGTRSITGARSTPTLNKTTFQHVGHSCGFLLVSTVRWRHLQHSKLEAVGRLPRL